MDIETLAERSMAVESEVTLNVQELMVLIEALSEYVARVVGDSYVPPAFESHDEQMEFLNSLGVKLMGFLIRAADTVFHDQDKGDIDLLEDTLRDIRDIRGAN